MKYLETFNVFHIFFFTHSKKAQNAQQTLTKKIPLKQNKNGRQNNANGIFIAIFFSVEHETI